MQFFGQINRESNAVALVKRGLVNERMANHRQIIDCICFLANALSETWKSASKEAAAGLALIAL